MWDAPWNAQPHHNQSMHVFMHTQCSTHYICFFAYVQVKAAHVAHVKLKTMRHPNILKYIDGFEVCACVHIRTCSSEIVKTIRLCLDHDRAAQCMTKYYMMP